MHSYINFHFENLEYDDKFFEADFYCEDLEVFCHFRYDRISKEYVITENTVPVEELLPLPIGWLELKLERSEKLKRTEWKISM